MNKILFVAVFGILTMAIQSVPSLAYVSLSYSASTVPTTVEPGQSANMLLTITNAGNEVAGNVNLNVKSTAYVSVGTSMFSVGSINAGGATTITVPIQILTISPEGSTSIPITTTYSAGSSSGTSSSDNSVILTITRRPLLQVTDVSYSNPLIQRGDTFRMNISLKNVGKGQVKDLIVSLRNFSLPIVPAGTDTEKFVGNLNPGDSTQVSFDLIVNNNADTITYSIPVTLTFYDESGTLNTNTKYVGLKVVGIPDFVVAIDKQENMYAGTVGKLTLSIANTGTGTAKFLTAYANSSDGDISPYASYIGNLDPDDSNTVTLDVGPMSTGKHDVTLYLSYKDSYNQDFTKMYPIEFSVGQMPIEIPLAFQILIVAIILAVAYWKRHSLMGIFKRKK
ncbi:MAG: hypothetical protein J4452_04665 [Candidatus Aenigmarchaeota archaeon]|nr:hypothetical protein [Candidatus Aenigmarchaeota archaeon]